MRRAEPSGAERSREESKPAPLRAWGSGIYGKLGHGGQQHRLLPKKVEAFAGQRVVAVSAGGEHSLAITADSAVFTWGEGERGCLGHGEDLSNQLLPKKIEARGGA